MSVPNPITIENRRTGTDRWKLRDGARAREVEGYASATSVAGGEDLSLHLSSSDPRVSVEIFRLGWYAGLGGRQVMAAKEVATALRTIPPAEVVTGLIECTWPVTYKVNVPHPSSKDAWTSGYYLVKLTALKSGKQAHIPFLVRDRRPAAHLMVAAVTTWQAYNSWGGKSLYDFNSTGEGSRVVSFDRPYLQRNGAGDALSWEYSMVRFLEREGFDVTYATNVDQHLDVSIFNDRRSYLSVGHDEYWSAEMRSNVELAASRGVHLGFFSANTCYWQARFEHSPAGAPARRLVSYKERALKEDPLARDADVAKRRLVTTKWRYAPVTCPEEQLIGVMYKASPVDGDIVIDDAAHWIFEGTGLTRGSRLFGLLGYEVDAVFVPREGLVRLGHSPFVATDDGEKGFSDMTFHTKPSGAMVFATGSIQWSWGLDAFTSPQGKSRVSVAAQQMTRNLLHRFA